MQDNELWRQLAEAKWGAPAVALSAKNGIAGPDTWFTFCQHRMCVKQHRCFPVPEFLKHHRGTRQYALVQERCRAMPMLDRSRRSFSGVVIIQLNS